jgi:hypothetical protein
MNKKIKTIELNKYEKEILDAFEKGELNHLYLKLIIRKLPGIP